MMIGTCRTMCPESEIRMREQENLLHPFEVATDHTSRRPKADRHKCVKEYHRPTVGNQETKRAELRPPDVLTTTVDYLINRVTTLNVKWADIYDFVFDRLRAVRQDLVIQECADKHAVSVLERAIRFYIYSDYRLCTEHIAVFDPKLNNQHTQECLKRLINLYKTREDSSPWQPEFEATYLLFNLGEDDALYHYLTLDKKLRAGKEVKDAFEMSCAYACNNWTRLLRKYARLASPVHLCAVHRHLAKIQRSALYTMSAGYSSKNLKYPISKLTQDLHVNTDTQTQQICETFGINVLGEHVQFMKGNFKKDEKLDRSQSDMVNERLKKFSVPKFLHTACSEDDHQPLTSTHR